MNGSGYEAEVVTMLQLKVRMLMFLGLAAMARFIVNPHVLRCFLRPSLTEAPFPPPELPGFVGNTDLSATPNGPAWLSRVAG